jgi:PIN domain nuclease of toxin-antitoxin system
LKLLLDTRVWLWMGLEPKRIGRETRAVLEDPANQLGVSVASAWEIIVKTARGKLELPMEASEYIRTRFRRAGATVLPITLDHVLALASLKDEHGDPFDRILIAQALSDSRTLLTADERLLAYPVISMDARS